MARTGKWKIGRLLVPSVAAIFTSLCATGASHASQGFNLADRFNNAIEAVQEGIDIIWPGDLDSEHVNARLGFGFGWVPDYVGSDSYRFRVLPIIDFRYKEVWRLNGSKFTYAAYKNGNFEAGPLLNLHFGRSESNNQFLAGLGDISTTLDVGAFARIKSKSLLIEADVRQALGAGQGMAVRFTAGHGIYQNGNFAAGAGFRLRYMSKKGMQTNFGITETQSANSLYGFAPFEAKAGISEASVNVIGAYRITDKVRLLSLVSVGHLFGSASTSPLSSGAAGSDLQVIAGTGITLQF
ncbi:MAG: MipA/OmpV family protein [Alphaproteobacteria bacterium]|nr:MipA/OmpV family protein [Alphaproteobacteria bacterium]